MSAGPPRGPAAGPLEQRLDHEVWLSAIREETYATTDVGTLADRLFTKFAGDQA